MLSIVFPQQLASFIMFVRLGEVLILSAFNLFVQPNQKLKKARLKSIDSQYGHVSLEFFFELYRSNMMI